MTSAPLQRLQCAEREKIGIAGPGADQKDNAGPRSVLIGTRDGARQADLRLVPATGQRRSGDRAVNDPFPEVPQ